MQMLGFFNKKNKEVDNMVRVLGGDVLSSRRLVLGKNNMINIRFKILNKNTATNGIVREILVSLVGTKTEKAGLITKPNIEINVISFTLNTFSLSLDAMSISAAPAAT